LIFVGQLLDQFLF